MFFCINTESSSLSWFSIFNSVSHQKIYQQIKISQKQIRVVAYDLELTLGSSLITPPVKYVVTHCGKLVWITGKVQVLSEESLCVSSGFLKRKVPLWVYQIWKHKQNNGEDTERYWTIQRIALFSEKSSFKGLNSPAALQVSIVWLGHFSQSELLWVMMSSCRATWSLQRIWKVPQWSGRSPTSSPTPRTGSIGSATSTCTGAVRRSRTWRFSRTSRGRRCPKTAWGTETSHSGSWTWRWKMEEDTSVSSRS